MKKRITEVVVDWQHNLITVFRGKDSKVYGRKIKYLFKLQAAQNHIGGVITSDFTTTTWRRIELGDVVRHSKYGWMAGEIVAILPDKGKETQCWVKPVGKSAFKIGVHDVTLLRKNADAVDVP